jgi:hypothetical protein
VAEQIQLCADCTQLMCEAHIRCGAAEFEPALVARIRQLEQMVRDLRPLAHSYAEDLDGQAAMVNGVPEAASLHEAAFIADEIVERAYQLVPPAWAGEEVK